MCQTSGRGLQTGWISLYAEATHVFFATSTRPPATSGPQMEPSGLRLIGKDQSERRAFKHFHQAVLAEFAQRGRAANTLSPRISISEIEQKIALLRRTLPDVPGKAQAASGLCQRQV